MDQTRHSVTPRDRIPLGIQLKDNQYRPYIHRYDLKIETKPTDMEADCERLTTATISFFGSTGRRYNLDTSLPHT
jgi:hypothetical protein